MNKWKFLYGLTIVAMAIVVGKIFVIQIVEHNKWVTAAAAQHTSESEIMAKRGDILMMDGEKMVPVVMNEAVYTVIIDPATANREKCEETIGGLASEYMTTNFEEAFKNLTLRYYIVAKNVPRKIALQIEEADLKGVWFKEGTKRTYVEGQMASGLLGFVNSEGVGQYGIEGALNKKLSGTNGLLKSIVDVNNVALSIGNDNIEVKAIDGEDVVLTVDRNIQIRVEQILEHAVEHSVATNAAAVVMNPNTGEILAMASVPNYDASKYWNVPDVSAYLNYTTEVPYEPASVCKTFIFSAGIDTGAMTPETKFRNVDSVVIDGNSGAAIFNATRGQTGWITLQRGLDYSLNTSSVQVLCLLGGNANCANAGRDVNYINETGRTKMYEYYHDRFGLGEATGIEILESAGIVPTPNQYSSAMNLTYSNMTFGQGVNLTMVQVASAFSSVVNGGKYYTPTVVKGYIDGEGNFALKKDKVEPVRQTVSEETSKTMRAMLWGTRSRMRTTGVDRSGYYVGGKSGTGQVILENGVYSAADGETIGSYIGYGSRDGQMPAYVVMVKLWGKNQHLAGVANAQPVFNDISNYLQDYLRI